MAQNRWILGSESDSSPVSQLLSSSSFIVHTLRKYWFLLAIVGAIILADIVPTLGHTGGPLHPEITVKYIAVSLIFFNSGLSLKSKDLLDALLYAKLHLYVQGFSLCFIPVFMMVLVYFFRLINFLPETFQQGLLVLSCMPTPVGTAVILTKAAGGNEAAAVFNSAFGSVLGVVITPLLILNVLGSSVYVSLGSVLGKLSLTVVLPVAIGQIVRFMTGERLSFLLPHLNIVNSISLLLIIFSTFCDSVMSEASKPDFTEIVIIVLLVCLLHTALLWFSFTVCQMKPFSFTPSDVVAVTFSSTEKSLTLGIPMLKIIFPDIARQSMLAIPLLAQEPCQILIGGFLVTAFKTWLQRPKSDWSSSSRITTFSTDPAVEMPNTNDNVIDIEKSSLPLIMQNDNVNS